MRWLPAPRSWGYADRDLVPEIHLARSTAGTATASLEPPWSLAELRASVNRQLRTWVRDDHWADYEMEPGDVERSSWAC